MGYGWQNALRTLLITSVMGLTATGCSTDGSLGPMPIQESKVTITPAKLTLDAIAEVGEFSAVRTDGQGRISNLDNFVWRSLDPDVVEIDNRGRIISLGAGTGIIEVSANGDRARAEVVVDQIPVTMSVTPGEDTLSVIGEQISLRVTARDRNGFPITPEGFEWESSKPDVADVSPEGRVTGYDVGWVWIRARAKRGSREDSSRVTVRNVSDHLSVQPDLDTLFALGHQVQMTATLTNSSGAVIAPNNLKWASSAPEVADITGDGMVTARSRGSAQIIAKVQGKEAAAQIVVHPTAGSVTISPRTSSLDGPGEDVQLTAQARDAEGNLLSNVALTWNSLDPAVVSVDQEGLAMAVGSGSGRVVAAAESGATGLATVSVKWPVVALNVAPRVDTLEVGENTELSINPVDAGGYATSCSDVQWTSRNTTVADVSSTGRVTAKALGVAAILVSACALTDSSRIVAIASSEDGGSDGSEESGSGGSGEDSGSGGSSTPSSGGSQTAPALPRLTPDISMPAVQRTTRVHNGSELQAAIDAAQAGDEILLDPGVTYTASGGFTLKARSDGGWAIIRTDLSLPTSRVDSTANLAKITCTGSNCSALTADQGADYGWRIEGVEVTTPPGSNAAVRLHGSGIPRRFVLDRVYVHPENDGRLVRCVLGNAASIAVIRSVLAACHADGQDSQAFVAWNTPGPILLEDNYLAGAGENVMFGGALPSSQANIPADITIRRNHFHKPPEWHGSQWTIKNLFELKTSARVLVEGNVFEGNWGQAQTGFGILLKSADCDWCGTSDVTLRNNILRDSENGFNLAGQTEGAPAMARVLIENTILEGIGSNGPYQGGEGRALQILGSIAGLTVRGWTSENPNMQTYLNVYNDGGIAPVSGSDLVIEDYVAEGPTSYGFHGTFSAWASHALQIYYVGGSCAGQPSGVTCPGSAPTGAGADVQAVLDATAGVVR